MTMWKHFYISHLNDNRIWKLEKVAIIMKVDVKNPNINLDKQNPISLICVTTFQPNFTS